MKGPCEFENDQKSLCDSLVETLMVVSEQNLLEQYMVCIDLTVKCEDGESSDKLLADIHVALLSGYGQRIVRSLYALMAIFH
jgi:hypothetical protein